MIEKILNAIEDTMTKIIEYLKNKRQKIERTRIKIIEKKNKYYSMTYEKYKENKGDKTK